MFTVLIAEKEHIDAIQQNNKLFFEPFLDNKDLAFCEWNPEGQNLHDSVPGLLDAVGRKKDWRAVILHTVTPDTLKMVNPFDVVDNSGVAALTAPSHQLNEGEDRGQWEKSWEAYFEALTSEKEAVYRRALENPLQKLTTWLCFHPEDYILNEVKETQGVEEWALEKVLNDEKDNSNLSNVKVNAFVESLEREQYKKELRIKETIRREFVGDTVLNIAHPKEVYCITPRTTESGKFDPDAYWTIRRDCEYSEFADRNMYFDKMRFMVFDLLAQSHRNFRNEYIHFLAVVLIFASNPVPGSAMKARRLYQLDTQIDETPLMTMVTSYDRKLAATSEVIDSQMEHIRSEIPGEMTDKAAEAMFCTSNNIAVVLDKSCSPEKVFVDKEYGLFYDHPTNELHKWNRDYKTSRESLAYIVKQQLRSVKKSVGQMHFASEISDVNVSRLTPFQMDDIREYTDAAENEMVASIPPDLADMSRFTGRLEEASKNVKKTLKRRMTMKTTIILAVICLGLYLICFLPFLFANTGTPRTVTTAIVLSAIMLALLAVTMFVTLLALRSSVKNVVRDYNNTAHGVMNEIETSLGQFSQYLTAACNVRRGHAVQKQADKNVDVYTKSLRIRRKHQEDIRKLRAYLAEDYKDYFGDSSYCDDVMVRPYEYDFDMRVEYPYPAPFLAGDCRQMEFMCTGNYVTVPSSYVTRIMVRMEEIYDE